MVYAALARPAAMWHMHHSPAVVYNLHAPFWCCLLQEVRRSLWPEQAAQPAFIDHLRKLYDETQLEAIEVSESSGVECTHGEMCAAVGLRWPQFCLLVDGNVPDRGS